MSLIDEIAAPAALRSGLDAAARNQGRPGPDGISIAAFAAHAQHELERLRDELLTGSWRPRPTLRVQIGKPGGGHRRLAIGCVRDRVVQHAAAQVLARTFDHLLHPSAYHYCPKPTVGVVLDRLRPVGRGAHTAGSSTGSGAGIAHRPGGPTSP